MAFPQSQRAARGHAPRHVARGKTDNVNTKKARQAETAPGKGEVPMKDHVIHPGSGCKPAIDASDAAELIRAKRASPQNFNKLMAFHRTRGVPNKEIFAAMAASPCMVDPLGSKRRRP